MNGELWIRPFQLSIHDFFVLFCFYWAKDQIATRSIFISDQASKVYLTNVHPVLNFYILDTLLNSTLDALFLFYLISVNSKTFIFS